MRICAAEFYVTNAFGKSQGQSNLLFRRPENAFRRTIFVAGERLLGHSTKRRSTSDDRSVARGSRHRATVGQPAIGYEISIDILQDGAFYANLRIPDGHTVSDIDTNVLNLAPLAKKSVLTMNVTLNVSWAVRLACSVPEET